MPGLDSTPGYRCEAIAHLLAQLVFRRFDVILVLFPQMWSMCEVRGSSTLSNLMQVGQNDQSDLTDRNADNV